MLDTSWHNSIGTVLDALWAATPVVSMASSRASSRAAASALIAAGTPQALARDLRDYAAVARALVRLSQQQARRHELRRRLAAARDAALFDSRRWIAAWERWLALAVDAHVHASPGRRCVHAHDACGVHVIAAG